MVASWNSSFARRLTETLDTVDSVALLGAVDPAALDSGAAAWPLDEEPPPRPFFPLRFDGFTIPQQFTLCFYCVGKATQSLRKHAAERRWPAALERRIFATQPQDKTTSLVRAVTFSSPAFRRGWLPCERAIHASVAYMVWNPACT